MRLGYLLTQAVARVWLPVGLALASGTASALVWPFIGNFHLSALIFFAVAALACSLNLWKELPCQNVLAIGAVLSGAPIAACVVLTHLGAETAARVFSGPVRLALTLPALTAVGLGWYVIGASSRGAAKALLSSRAQVPAQGYAVLGLTSVLLLIACLGAELLFQVSMSAAPEPVPIQWNEVATFGFARAILCGGLIVMVTPWFIRKRPGLGPPGAWSWTWHIATGAIYGAWLSRFLG
jgi:hypothetical protein